MWTSGALVNRNSKSMKKKRRLCEAKEMSHEDCVNSPQSTWNEVPVDTWAQFIFTLTLFLSFIIVFKTFEHSPYKMISIFIVCVTTHWMVLFLTIILTTKHLHLVYVETRPFPVSSRQSTFLAPTSFPKEIQYKEIVSISSFFAIHGTNMDKLSSFLLYIHFSLVLCASIMNWDDNTYDNALWKQILLSGCIGCFLMVSFELKPNILSYSMHYIGVGLTGYAGPCAFALQQNWSFSSVAIILGTIVCAIAWIALSFGWNMERNNDTKHSDEYMTFIHMKSKLCVLIEVGLLCFCDLGVVLTIYNMKA
eukprot:174983_1